MSTIFTTANGFFFRNNKGQFVSPKELGIINSYKVANSLVQVKPLHNCFGLFLMKANDTETKNEVWKVHNKFKYLSNEAKNLFGTYDQKPSCFGSEFKPLKVFMLKVEIAERFLTTNLLYLNEREYKDVSSFVQAEYLVNFKYEFPSNMQLPTSTVPKQSTNLSKTGNTLVPRPVMKIS